MLLLSSVYGREDGDDRSISETLKTSMMYVDAFKDVGVCVLGRCFSKNGRRAFLSLHNRALLSSVEEAERRQQCIAGP